MLIGFKQVFDAKVRPNSHPNRTKLGSHCANLKIEEVALSLQQWLEKVWLSLQRGLEFCGLAGGSWGEDL